MSGKITHEQQLRTFERKDDVPKPGDPKEEMSVSRPGHGLRSPEARQSEMSVSERGMQQESRQHNKHNEPPKGASKS